MKKENQKLKVVIGWNNGKYNAKALADGFEEEGYKVIRVAADADLPERSGTFDYHLMEMLIAMFPYDTGMNSKRPGYQNMTKYQIEMTYPFLQNQALSVPIRYVLKKIEEDHGPIYDILVCQVDLVLDMQDVTIPWDYYFTEDYKPTLPINGNPRGVFYGYIGGDQCLLRSFPHQWYRWDFCKLVPYGMDKMAIPTEIKPWKDRVIDVGFKGLLHLIQKSTNMTVRNAYDERRRIVQYVDHWMNSPNFKKVYPKIRFQYESHTTFEHYIPFMLDTKIALNVQGGFGIWLNQRMYEALGFKCLLLQNFFPQLNDYGLVDKETCLIYSSEVELQEKIEWAINNPDKAEAIAERGHQLFLTMKLSWQDRAREMLQILAHPKDERWTNYKQRMNQYQREINEYANNYCHTKGDPTYEYRNGTVYEIELPPNTT